MRYVKGTQEPTESSLMWGRPVHCRIFSSVPHCYVLDAYSILPVVTAQNISRCCQMSPLGAKNHPQLRTIWLKEALD